MRTKRIVLLLAVVALMGALAATHGDGCDLFDGNHHAIATCSAAILPVPLVLGLLVISFFFPTNEEARPQFVLVPIDRPPRRLLAR